MKLEDALIWGFIVFMLIFGPAIRDRINSFWARKNADLDAWIERDKARRGIK